jgi:hypothetical protein
VATSLEHVEDLRFRLDHLTLVTEALWSFFVDQGCTQQQLVDRMTSLDVMDGRLDNRRVHRGVCTKCGASVATDRCQFCGTQFHDPFAGP